MEALKTQSAIVSKSGETKDFDRMNTGRSAQRQIEIQLKAQTRIPVKQKCIYCGSSHLSRWCLAYGRKCTVCRKINHYKEVCRSGRNKRSTASAKKQISTRKKMILTLLWVFLLCANWVWTQKLSTMTRRTFQFQQALQQKIDASL